MTNEQKEALAKLDVADSVVLDCCNDPVHGVTNCPTVVRMYDDSFALVGDDGTTIKLSIDQFIDLVDRGSMMLDALD